jgi:hypothetical protein
LSKKLCLPLKGQLSKNLFMQIQYVLPTGKILIEKRVT